MVMPSSSYIVHTAPFIVCYPLFTGFGADFQSYNASIYQVVPLDEYAVSIIENNSSDWSAQRMVVTDGLTKELTVMDLEQAYGRGLGAGWRDVTLSIDGVNLECFDYKYGKQIDGYSGEVKIVWVNNGWKNITLGAARVHPTLPSLLRNENGTSEWIDNLDDEG